MSKRRLYVLSALALLVAPASAQPTDDQMLQRMMAGGPILDPAPLAAAIAQAAAHPLGTKQNPVRAHGPAGQHAYLRRLRCSDGSAPRWERAGNAGPGPFLSIVDIYSVDCGQAAPGKVRIVMDMYHPNFAEPRAVAGFTTQQPNTI